MRDAGGKWEKFVRHEQEVSESQTFRVFSQHTKWVITPGNRYCFYEINLTFSGFTGAMKDRFLTNEGAPSISVTS